MNFLSLITILLLTTHPLQPLHATRKDRFSGCESDLFPNPSNFLILKIDFSAECKALEICADDPGIVKEKCISQFNDGMDAFCPSYTRVNLWRRKYCFRIVEKNKLIANLLSDDVFKTCELEEDSSKITLIGNSMRTFLLNHTSLEDIFFGKTADSFFKEITLDNSYVIYEILREDVPIGKCLLGVDIDSKLVAGDCNYCDPEQQFELGDFGTVFSLKNVKTNKYLDPSTGIFDSNVEVGINFLGPRPS